MNLRKIIKEEIENLPSFGKTTCMLVHKSGNIFMSNNDNMLVFSTYEELQNSLNDNFFKIIHYCRDCEEQEQRLKRLIEKTEAYEKYGPSQRYEPSYRTNYGALTMKEPYKYDPREFEVVEYYQGFIPKTSNIFESEKNNDFDWLEDVPNLDEWEVKMYDSMVKAFKNTEFKVDVDRLAVRKYILINDKHGDNYSALYLNGNLDDWSYTLKKDIQQSINICGEDCNLTQKFKEIYKIFNDYFYKNIHESKTDDFDWSENTGHEFTKEINTEEANQNFKNEVNGYYAISTPKGKDFPETILAYGPVFYIKQVLSYINDLDDPYWGNMDLYLGKITYSRKDKDNVLSLTKYY